MCSADDIKVNNMAVLKLNHKEYGDIVLLVHDDRLILKCKDIKGKTEKENYYIHDIREMNKALHNIFPIRDLNNLMNNTE